MEIYTVGEFRSNMKKALDAVSEGTQVTIVRGTDIFIIQKGRVEVQGKPIYRGTPEKTETPKPAEYEIGDLVRDDAPKKSVGATPVREQLGLSEFPCCLNEITPCKHWVWDAQTGDGYKNILSGRFMEVEG